MGFVKMVNEIDAREAANQGMVIRPLTQANIQKHLESVGLESEFATHSRMRGLSGGAGSSIILGSRRTAATPGVSHYLSATSAACCLSCVSVVLPACLHRRGLRFCRATYTAFKAMQLGAHPICLMCLGPGHLLSRHSPHLPGMFCCSKVVSPATEQHCT